MLCQTHQKLRDYETLSNTLHFNRNLFSLNMYNKRPWIKLWWFHSTNLQSDTNFNKHSLKVSSLTSNTPSIFKLSSKISIFIKISFSFGKADNSGILSPSSPLRSISQWLCKWVPIITLSVVTGLVTFKKLEASHH